VRRLACFIIVLTAAIVTAVRPTGQAAIGAAPAASLRFAVIGDNGTGDREQFDLARRMAAMRAAFPFEIVLMLGDNMYGSQKPKDFLRKFELPFKPLLDGGVRFYATLGNHDSPDNRFFPGFNMGGARYYTFTRGRVRFLVLDTNVLDGPQIAWADATLRDAAEAWKIAYFHHPLYSNGGRHGSNVELRVRLEPVLVRHGVSVVFSGHDHLYERILPQKGITYFVAGSGGKLRKGFTTSSDTAAVFDRDQTFLLAEITGDEMAFRAVTRTGSIVDSGVIRRRVAATEEAP
jgi:3',5'-cyclic AMP phosphodiesterase CpdA